MITILVKYVWLLSALTLATGAHFSGMPQNQPLKLMVDRKEKTNECMRGFLMTKSAGEKDAKVQCLILETPPRGTTPTLNGIPVGTYKVVVRADGDRGWRLEIKGVPGKQSLFIRLGNCPANTANCLLVGTKTGGDECTVADSEVALKGLKTVFQGFGASKETEITIR